MSVYTLPAFRQRTPLGVIACLCVLLALAPVSPARAISFDNALDSMFYRATTDARPYESQRRSGYVAGSMSFRAPVRNYNIIAFDPPRIRAGCAGLDLFGGSFSFVNGEQLKLLIKQIGSAALGYAVYLAINEMCKPCGATISFLQKIMTELNSMNVNSCKIAKGLVNSINDPSNVKEVVSQKDGMLSRIRGYFSDWTKEMEENYKSPEKSSRYADLDSGGSTSLNPDNPMKGNLVWRGLYRDLRANAIGDPTAGVGGVIDVQMAQYLMSITGTYVIPMVGTTTGCPDTTGSGTYDNPYPKECLPHPYEPLLSLHDLLNGAGSEAAGGYPNKVEYWRCTDSTASGVGCQKMAKAQFTFPGTLGYVHKQLFGDSNHFRSDYNGGSIIDRIAKGQSLTAAQVGFMNMIPFPLYAMLQKLQRNPGAISYFARLAERPVADMLAITLGQAILRVSHQVFSGHSEVTPPPNWNKRLARIEATLSPYIARGEKQLEWLNSMSAGASNIVKSFPQPITALSKPGGN